MKIRPAIKSDIKEIIAFQMAMAKETENITLDKKTVERGITAVINDIQKARYFVAEQNKKLLGCFMVTPEWSDWRAGFFIWLQSIYVIPEFRKQGVYHAMYAYLKDIVKNNSDYKGIRLYVDKANQNAIQVYEKTGMHKTNYQMLEWTKP
ncbi:MAG: GNAT family N-acetyltransferase [Candidatus Delongbacteria bacterium]|jgi:ribosomal protein S18 acetylase RimI-like enzyme|nr:GNAT family N-acetyltransferase [Candidatus Delongbacteria bacterium]